MGQTCRMVFLLACVFVSISSACSRSGGGTSELVAEVCTPYDLQVDGSHLYYSCDASIQRVALSGGAPEPVLSDPDGPRSLALHGDRIFWTTKKTHVVKEAAKGGGDPRLIISFASERSGVGKPMRIAVDEKFLYVTGLPGLVRIDRSSGELLRLLDDITGSEMKQDATHLYWSTPASLGTPGKIFRLAKAGGAPELLLIAERLRSFALHDQHLFTCTNPISAGYNKVDGGLMRYSKSGGKPVQLSTRCGEDLLVAGRKICWAFRSSYTSKWASSLDCSVECAPLKGSSGIRDFVTLYKGTFCRGPVVSGEKIYWIGCDKVGKGVDCKYKLQAGAPGGK